MNGLGEVLNRSEDSLVGVWIGGLALRDQANLLDTAQHAIAVLDMDQRILLWNKGAEKLYGWPAREVVGKSIHDLLDPGNVGPAIDVIKCLIRSRQWQGILRQRTRDGRFIEVENRWTLLRDRAGNPKSILVIGKGIVP